MKGFTLIELMVTVSIIIVISVGALVNYYVFDAKQKLRDEANEVMAFLDKARSKALAMDYPNGCNNLQFYQIEATKSSGDFVMKAICGGIGVEVESEKITRSTEINTDFTVRFVVPSGEISTKEDLVIVLKSLSRTEMVATLTVDYLSMGKNTLEI